MNNFIKGFIIFGQRLLLGFERLDISLAKGFTSSARLYVVKGKEHIVKMYIFQMGKLNKKYCNMVERDVYGSS